MPVFQLVASGPGVPNAIIRHKPVRHEVIIERLVPKKVIRERYVPLKLQAPPPQRHGYVLPRAPRPQTPPPAPRPQTPPPAPRPQTRMPPPPPPLPLTLPDRRDAFSDARGPTAVIPSRPPHGHRTVQPVQQPMQQPIQQPMQQPMQQPVPQQVPHPMPQRVASASRRPRQRPRSTSRLNVDLLTDANTLKGLSESDLIYLAMTARTALQAAEEREAEDAEGTVATVEVVCPPEKKAGDVIEVRLPADFGGGVVSVSVPVGVLPGQTFELHPRRRERSRRSSRSRYTLSSWWQEWSRAMNRQ